MDYRINAKLRRKGQAALETNRIEIKSEDYDSDEDFIFALASELKELIASDRDYLDQIEE